MNQIVQSARSDPSMQPHMSAPVVWSFLLHGMAVAFMIIGLPQMKPALPDIARPISIQIASPEEVAELSQAPEPKQTPPPQNEAEKPPPMPTVTATEPPRPTAPEAPAERVALPEPEDKETEPQEAPMPEPAAIPDKKPKPPQKLDPAKEKEQTEESQEAFSSLLRNLMPSEAEQRAEGEGEAESSNPIDQFASRMTADEHEALRQQLASCWSVMAGAKFAEDLVVKIRLVMNPDRTVQSAQVVDQLRFNTDKVYRAAAENALRAINHPRCERLDLPPQKYEQWKSIVFTFDPSNML